MDESQAVKSISARLETAEPSFSESPVSIRVALNSYINAFLVGTFFSGLLVYLEFEASAFVLFLVSWIVIPTLAFTDRIVFDGKRLSRSGIGPRLWAWFSNSRDRLKISDIEQIETASLRAIKRGGILHYRYRTALLGRGVNIVITSGGESYRTIISRILSAVPNEVLDQRSADLRDHLADPKEVAMKAAFAKIPESDVLESVLFRRDRKQPVELSVDDEERDGSLEAIEARAEDLRILGNELKIAGRLHQSLEAFRRALVLRPSDARLIFDLARCLSTIAGVRRDNTLHRRSLAALRLTEQRADKDSELYARLGEVYFTLGEWKRSAAVFLKAIEFGNGYLGSRGLAEIALREGKLAHVVHQFSAANRSASTPSLRRYSKGEAEYFGNLSRDREYLDLEVGRVNLLSSLESGKQNLLRIASLSSIPLFAGTILEDTLFTDVGWAVAGVSLLIWTIVSISTHLFSTRIPYELTIDD